MEHEIAQAVVKEIIQDSTVMAAIVAIVAATFAPMLTALVNKHWEHKTKKLEIFFHEKAEAYSDLFRVADSLTKKCEPEDVAAATAALARALLFVPDDSRQLTSDFMKAAIESGKHISRMDVGNDALKAAAKAGKLRNELLQKLHDDLLEQGKHLPKSKHKVDQKGKF